MRYVVRLLVLTLAISPVSVSAAEANLRALIIDGQGQHDWKATTPILKKHLEDMGMFKVDVATSPPQGGNMNAFSPKFADYNVIVSNYDGDEWSAATKKALVDYMLAGGGLVIVHAAGNSFTHWPEWSQLVGLSSARMPEEGPPHAYMIDLMDESHPITIGLPKRWQHAPDELPLRLNGEPDNVHILAEAFSEAETESVGQHVAAFFTVDFGPGSIFHTTLGHNPASMKCVGFMVLFQRGTEWAATGEVTYDKVPSDFPTRTQASVRP